MKIKKWEKPKLIILARGRPEEAVLSKCKIASDVGPGGSNCQWTVGGDCDVQAAS